MRTEIATTITFIIGIALKLLHYPGGSTLIIISLATLALIYFPAGGYFFCDKKMKNQNLPLSVISGLLLAVSPIAITYKLLYWPGATLLLIISVISTLLALGAILLLQSGAKEALKIYYRNMKIRAVTLSILSIALYLTPMSALLQIQEWDDPELARIKFNAYSNPANEEFQKALDDYLIRRDSLQYQLP